MSCSYRCSHVFPKFSKGNLTWGTPIPQSPLISTPAQEKIISTLTILWMLDITNLFSKSIRFHVHTIFTLLKMEPTSPWLVSLRFVTPSFRGSKTPSVKAKSADELRVQDGLTIGKRNSCGIDRYQPWKDVGKEGHLRCFMMFLLKPYLFVGEKNT